MDRNINLGNNFGNPLDTVSCGAGSFGDFDCTVVVVAAVADIVAGVAQCAIEAAVRLVASAAVVVAAAQPRD